MKLLGIVTWVVTALASLVVGLKPLGYNLLEAEYLVNNPQLLPVIQYVVGACGVISLAMLLSSLSKGGACGCSCGK